jgi:hypothetical protein
MSEQNEAIANALELLVISQNGIGAAIEELAKWVAERGLWMWQTTPCQLCKSSTQTPKGSPVRSDFFVKNSYNKPRTTIQKLLY